MAVISKLYIKILAVLLTCLGFSGTVNSCNGNRLFGGDEYGTPSATYKAKGTVVSETDNTPINGIRAELTQKYVTDSEEKFFNIGSPAYSNKNGDFSTEGGTHSSHEILYVKLTDIDGKENGSFSDKVIEADFSNAVFAKSSNKWDRGKAEINLGTIKMTPAE